MADTNYQCNFCQMRFVHEKRFIDHKCDQMKRREFLKTPAGQSAWLLYQKWMKAYNRAVPNVNAYLNSMFFNSFVRFAEFVKQAKIPDVDIFVNLMRERDIDPKLWNKDEVYTLYIEHMDKKISPARHAEITIDCLMSYAEDHNVDVADVFTVMTPNEVAVMIRQRRLSPWILLHSKKFLEQVYRKANAHEKPMLEALIRPQYWSKKFEKTPDTRKTMKALVNALNI